MAGRILYGLYEIWYRREPIFMSDLGLRAEDLRGTHEYITHQNHKRDVMGEDWAHCTNLQWVYNQMQGMNWSPHGEARPLLRRRGINHTSMSIGDVIVSPDGEAFEVADYGFRSIGYVKDGSDSFITAAG